MDGNVKHNLIGDEPFTHMILPKQINVLLSWFRKGVFMHQVWHAFIL